MQQVSRSWAQQLQKSFKWTIFLPSDCSVKWTTDWSEGIGLKKGLSSVKWASCFYIGKTEIWAQEVTLATMLANIKIIKAERGNSRKNLESVILAEAGMCCCQSNQEFAGCFVWGQLQTQAEAGNIWCKGKGQDFAVQPCRLWSLGHFFGQWEKTGGQRAVGSGQWMDTMDTFPRSYCCLYTLLHPGSSSSSNLDSFRLSTVLRKGLCVSSTLDLAWHQSSSFKRSKSIHLAKEHGDGSKYRSFFLLRKKKCVWDAVFLEAPYLKERVNSNFDFSCNIDIFFLNMDKYVSGDL